MIENECLGKSLLINNICKFCLEDRVHMETVQNFKILSVSLIFYIVFELFGQAYFWMQDKSDFSKFIFSSKEK